VKGRPIAAIVLRQIYLLRGSPVRVFPMVTWVAIDIVLWGFITRYLNSVAGSGVNFVPTLLGGVLLWDFCTRIMQGVSTAFLEDVWSRNFLNLFASPLSISEYMGRLKGKSAIRVLSVFRDLRRHRFWGNHFWAQGYCVGTVGLDEDMIRKYVKWQEKEEQKQEEFRFVK